MTIREAAVKVRIASCKLLGAVSWGMEGKLYWAAISGAYRGSEGHAEPISRNGTNVPTKVSAPIVPVRPNSPPEVS